MNTPLLTARCWTLLLSTLVLAGSFLLCHDAFAYARVRTDENVPVYWKTLPITYWISRPGSQNLPQDAHIDVIKTSFATWNGQDCSRFSFTFGGLLDAPKAEYIPGGNNQNVVLWIEREGAWEHPSDVLAVTPLKYNGSTGEIHDADIMLNGVNFRWSIQTPVPQGHYDVQNTVTHEAGHVLGLDHSDDQNAAMYGDAPVGDISKRSLKEDDRIGVCSIYPKDPADQFSFLVLSSDIGLAPCKPASQLPPAPPPETSNNCNSTSHHLPPSLLLLLLLLALPRRIS